VGSLGPEVVGAGGSHGGGVEGHDGTGDVLETIEASRDAIGERVTPHGDGGGGSDGGSGSDGGGGSDGGSGSDSRGSSVSHRSGNSSNNRLGRSREDSTASSTVGSTGSSHSGGLNRHHSAKNVLESSKTAGDGISKRVGLDDGGGGGNGRGSGDGGSSGDSRGSSVSHRGGNSSNNRLGRSREDSTTSSTMGSTGSSHGGGLLGHYSAENILESSKAARDRVSKGDSLDNSRGGSNGSAIAISSTGGGSNSGDEAKESKQDLHDVS